MIYNHLGRTGLRVSLQTLTLLGYPLFYTPNTALVTHLELFCLRLCRIHSSFWLVDAACMACRSVHFRMAPGWRSELKLMSSKYVLLLVCWGRASLALSLLNEMTVAIGQKAYDHLQWCWGQLVSMPIWLYSIMSSNWFILLLLLQLWQCRGICWWQSRRGYGSSHQGGDGTSTHACIHADWGSCLCCHCFLGFLILCISHLDDEAVHIDIPTWA